MTDRNEARRLQARTSHGSLPAAILLGLALGPISAHGQAEAEPHKDTAAPSEDLFPAELFEEQAAEPDAPASPPSAESQAAAPPAGDTTAQADAGQKPAEAPLDTIPVPVKAESERPPARKPARGQIEEIVVTAQKSAAGIQDVPVAVSALQGDDLAYRGVSDLGALQRTVPSLNFSERGGVTMATIRGVGLNVDLGGAEPAVAQHIDGVYQPRATTGVIGMADLARMEVLRGPQGTLYGRNATGGAINFIMNEPTDSFEGRLMAGMGTFSGRDGKFTGIVSGPLFDNVLNGRAMIDYSRDRGHVTEVDSGQTLADLETLQGRVALSLFPHEDFTAKLSVLYRKDENLEPANVLITPPDPAMEAQLTIVPPTQSNPDDYIVGDYHRVKLSFLPTGERDTTNAALTVTWDLESVVLKSITGYQDHQIERSYDEDTTRRDSMKVIGWRDTSTSLSQELNLSGEGDWGRWLLGAYHFSEDYFITTPVDVPTFGGGVGLGITQVGNEEIGSQALFVDLTVKLGQSWRLFGGARYSEDEKHMVQDRHTILGGLNGPVVTDVPGATCSNQRTDQRFHNFSPRYGLQFDLADDVMLYAQQQRGYKAGGTNFADCGNTYLPEQVESSEFGLKSSWFDRTLTANMALFINDYTNFQVFKVTGIQGLVVNAPAARIRGAELELAALPWEPVKLDLTATYLDAVYTEFRDTDPANPNAGEQDLAGNTMNRAPKYSFNIGVEYQGVLNTLGFGGFRLRGEYFQTDDVVFRPYGGALDRQGGYSLVNAVASFTTHDEQLTLRLYGKNLTDTDYYDYIFAATEGHRNGPTGTPRNFGIEATYSF